MDALAVDEAYAACVQMLRRAGAANAEVTP